MKDTANQTSINISITQWWRHLKINGVASGGPIKYLGVTLAYSFKIQKRIRSKKRNRVATEVISHPFGPPLQSSI